jgi:hypothetical protein
MQIDGNTTITFNVTVDQANVLLAALGTQPYDRVAPIIGTIQQQAQAQLAQAAQAAQAAAEAPAAPAAE